MDHKTRKSLAVAGGLSAMLLAAGSTLPASMPIAVLNGVVPAASAAQKPCSPAKPCAPSGSSKMAGKPCAPGRSSGMSHSSGSAKPCAPRKSGTAKPCAPSNPCAPSKS